MIKITNETVKELILLLFKRLVDYSSKGYIEKDFILRVGALVFTLQTREAECPLKETNDMNQKNLQ